ncbi:MAG: T9SS type A sorting domain-containing protein [Dysgonomonas sp.]
MKKLIYTLLLLGIAVFGMSQNTVNVDPSFNISDLGNGYGDGPSTGVEKIIKTSDNKILLAGNFSKYNDRTIKGLVKINEDGSIDTSFNPNGEGTNGSVNTLKLQSDGKIIIGGTFTTYNGISANRIARLNADGTLDTSFNIGTAFNNTVYSISLQPDGKILIGGNFTLYDENDAFRIVRLNTNGSIDTSFDTSVGANNNVNAIAVDNTGRIIIGGNFTSINGSTSNRVARLLSNGTVDASFNVGTGANTTISTILVRNDKIYIGGNLNTYNGITVNKITRLNDDGSIDTSFSTGTAFNDAVYNIIYHNNSLYVLGYFKTYNGINAGRVINLLEDGSVATSFNNGNVGADGSVNDMLFSDNNNIIISGYFTNFNGIGKQYLTKITESGVVDMNFNKGVGVNKNVNSIAVLDDKSLVIGGAFNLYNNNIVNYIAKTDIDGNLDETFKNNIGSGFNSTVNIVNKLNSGKILVSGEFSMFDDITANRIAILNADGSTDTGFTSGTGFNNTVNSIAETSDGKLIAVGNFTAYGSTTINRIIRINADGSYDPEFNIGTGSTTTISSLAVQDDGKVIIGGSFTSFNQSSYNRILRLNTDGSIDATFNVGTGANYPVLAIAIQADGKILIGGNFSTYNGTTINRIARLNADGSLDATFITGTGLNTNPTALTIQDDGKIIVIGTFTTYNGATVKGFIRLNTDGSLDNNFTIGTGADNTIKTVVSQDKNKIIIGGAFTNFNAVGKNRFARLLITDETLSIDNIKNNDFKVYPNPFNSTINIQSAQKPISNQIFDLSGKKIYNNSGYQIDLNNISNGVYILKTVLENGEIATEKIVKK